MFLIGIEFSAKTKGRWGALKLNIKSILDDDYFCADSKKWKMGGFALNLEIQILLPDDRLMKERI